MIADLDQQLGEALKNKNFELATTILNKIWLYTQIQMTQITSPELKELTMIKTPVDTGDGKYLLLFIHVDGKKIQL